MNGPNYRWLRCLALICLLWLIAFPKASAYGVLTHQAVIDAAWDASIQPLLLRRFPGTTKEQLREAHAYAYGGSIVQDMGYYPFGSVFFTNLLHYTRSGDFVENLIKTSETLDEYAFSLGALAHYNADADGHPLGTNRAVPLVYPEVGAKYGKVVTYAEDPVSHVKAEFGFDVLQVARGNYAPESYHDFIGFKVAPKALERAFLQTYGLELKDVFLNLPLAITTYRYTIKGIFPELTKAAWQAKKDEIQAAKPGMTRRKFNYHMSNASFSKEWGKDYEKPPFFARVIAWIIKVMPKIGPLRAFAFMPPTPEAEKLYMASFNKTLEDYTAMLQKMRKDDLYLRNLELDTGKPTKAGTYKLADETYAKLIKKLAKDDFKHVTPALKKSLLSFYDNLKAPIATKEDDDDWKDTLVALDQLKAENF
jgi:hypothetical protein